MKLQFPFKDYTSEEIQNVHGDERNRMLLANDSRSFENASIILVVGIILFAAVGIILSIYN